MCPGKASLRMIPCARGAPRPEVARPWARGARELNFGGLTPKILLRANLHHIALAFLLGLLLPACAHTVPALPEGSKYRAGDARETIESLRASVEAIVRAGGNLQRFEAVRKRANGMGLGPRAHVAPIDWWTRQKNLLIEIPGSSGRIIYITAHYDKTDANPLKLLSLLLNGLPDEAIAWSFLSEGAIDNATGVAVALELARILARTEPRETYRVLLTGAEESGLRGSRAHLARLPARERDAIALTVNIDTVGLTFAPNCVTKNVSDDTLVEEALAAADHLEMPLEADTLPFGAYGDFTPFKQHDFARDLSLGLLFNLTGGLLPQRSWFTGAHEAPVITFSACNLVGPSDYAASVTLLPVGQIHGPRDRADRVSLERLYEMFAIISEFIESHSDSEGREALN